MSPTPDKSSQDKQLVAKSYDKISSAYTAWASTSPSSRLTYLDLALSELPPNSHILELGSGAGVPVLETILSHANVSTVYANDISTTQLSLARNNFPAAKFLQGDMLLLSFEQETLDAVVSFFSIFHLPRSEQSVMLKNANSWLKPGGLLVMNFATLDQEEIRNDFFGEEMFWSSFGTEKNLGMIRKSGFEVIKSEVLGSGENLKPGDTDYGIEFLWVFAKKREEAKE